MSRQIDPKYIIEGDGWIVSATTGVPIPEDEPLLLFRARDSHALEMLQFYRYICIRDGCTDFHKAGCDNRYDAFKKFRDEHPERMKEAGITKGL